MAKNINYRQLNPEIVEFRAIEENGQRFFVGYASLFNSRSKPIFEYNKLFTEIIAPGAFDEVLATNPDVRLNFNHERNGILARTKSGTLELSVDEKGLLFRASVPNTTLGNDTYELVKRQDLFENSFAFTVRKTDEEWTTDKEGNNTRVIKKIARLFDVAICTDGAYAGTTISARNDEERKTTITITIEDDPEEVDPTIPEVEAIPEEDDKPKEPERLKPTPGESKDEFMPKCIKYAMENEGKDNDQAVAMCAAMYDENRSNNPEINRMILRAKTLKLKI